MATRKYGKNSHTCRLCGNNERVIRRYGIMVCTRCFREVATDIGFKKYN